MICSLRKAVLEEIFFYVLPKSNAHGEGKQEFFIALLLSKSWYPDILIADCEIKYLVS